MAPLGQGLGPIGAESKRVRTNPGTNLDLFSQGTFFGESLRANSDCWTNLVVSEEQKA